MITGERPQGSAMIIPTEAATRWDYAQAQRVNEDLGHCDGNLSRMASALTCFIFTTHPDKLDLPPAMLDRYSEAKRFMTQYAGGEFLLGHSILARFQAAGDDLQNGYTHAVTATALSSDRSRPEPLLQGGMFVQRITLPDSVQQRALRWNSWAQAEIHEGRIDGLFGDHPNWVGAKLGEGSWLQAGNVMFEAVEGIGRIRTNAHDPHKLEKRWSVDQGPEWGAGLDSWYLTTHIVDKALLRLAASLGPDMIDSMKLTPESYVRSYRPMLEVIEANPQLDIKGLLSDGTWIYSDELQKLFPHQAVSGLHDVAGNVVTIGTARELGLSAQETFATHDPERERAAAEGRYSISIAARHMSPLAMRAQLQKFGL